MNSRVYYIIYMQTKNECKRNNYIQSRITKTFSRGRTPACACVCVNVCACVRACVRVCSLQALHMTALLSHPNGNHILIGIPKQLKRLLNFVNFWCQHFNGLEHFIICREKTIAVDPRRLAPNPPQGCVLV